MGSWMMNCCLREAHDLGGCGAQLVREPRTSTMVAVPRVVLAARRSDSRGLKRISEANLKHGRQTKDKLAAQRHAAKAGRRVMGELKRLEQQIVDAGLMPDE